MPSETAQCSIATLDLDDDGTLDLVVTHTAAPRVAVLLGASDGVFAPGVSYAVQGGTRAIALGDFDANRGIDLATVGDTGHVIVLLGNGDGTFGSSLVTSLGEPLESMATRGSCSVQETELSLATRCMRRD